METTTTVKKKVVRRKKKLTPEERVKNSSLKPQNKYIEAALKHQGSFTVYDPNFMLQESTAMGTTLKESTTRKKKKLTPEENRALNAAMPSRNKYTEAARKHQGSFIVYDPNFML